MNERKTEILVREALRAHGYFEDKSLTIEEQHSDNLRIKNFLNWLPNLARGEDSQNLSSPPRHTQISLS